MSYVSLTSFRDDNNNDFQYSNTNTDFSCRFREPITINPNSSIRLNFASVYLTSDLVKRPIFITTSSFTGMKSYMTGIGNVGLLGVIRPSDAIGGSEPANKNAMVVDNSFPYIPLKNAEKLEITEITISIKWEDGSVCNNLDGYTNSGVSVSVENQTTLGLQIIDPEYKDIN